MTNKALFSSDRVLDASPASKSGVANYARVTRYTLVSAVLFFSSSYAVACSLALEMSARMSRNSTEMSNVDRIALTNLAINARTLPMRSDAIVHGYAHEGEHDPASLASRRAQTVAQFLTQMGVAADLLDVESSIVASSSKRDPSEQVDIQFAPVCPTGGCGFLCNTPTPK
jgi:hypothetical protein